MAVEYETTPSTPGNPNPNTLFPLTGSTVKKRVIKHSNQENFRAGLFFCGKRKRSHRDRYHDYDHHRLHSSSVPRQREFYTPKNSYLEYKNRSRIAYGKPCERILPLTKNIVSKIEKISQDSMNASGSMGFTTSVVTANNETIIPTGFHFNSAFLKCSQNANNSQHQSQTVISNVLAPSLTCGLQAASAFQAKSLSIDSASSGNSTNMPHKSGSFDSSFNIAEHQSNGPVQISTTEPIKIGKESSRKGHSTSRHSNHKRKQSKRSHLKMQFSGQNGMDCGNLNDFLSSSSLSSSDSEAGETNESDREGDDELTDWPGNEAMVNFASKNDFKRAKPARNTNPVGSFTKASTSHARFGNEDCMAQDEDTLMSADELPTSYTSHLSTSQTLTEPINPLLNVDANLFPQKLSSILQSRLTSNDSLATISTSANQIAINSSRIIRNATSLPIDIVPQSHQNFTSGSHTAQIESEMSGETSNPFLPSPSLEVREIRAGCRRIRDERPGFTIFSSVNEHLSRFVIGIYNILSVFISIVMNSKC